MSACPRCKLDTAFYYGEIRETGVIGLVPTVTETWRLMRCDPCDYQWWEQCLCDGHPLVDFSQSHSQDP